MPGVETHLGIHINEQLFSLNPTIKESFLWKIQVPASLGPRYCFKHSLVLEMKDLRFLGNKQCY